MAKKLKTIQEAGNYGRLTPEEIKILNSAPGDIRGPVSSFMNSMRSKGNQMDLRTAVQQMLQTPHFAGNKNLIDFSTVASLGGLKKAPNPFEQGKNVPPPVDFASLEKQKMVQGLPQSQEKLESEKFEDLRQGDISNDEILRRQRLKRKINIPGGTKMGIGESFTIKEFMNPAMISTSLKGIMSAISKLNPEQLAAIVQMVNGLMQSKPGSRVGSASTRMENKKMKSNQMMITEVVKVTIREQVSARNTAQTLLEGPLANVWDKIKGAGSAIGQKMGMGGGQQQMPGADNQSKQASQELTKIIGKINQYRQKFNSSILKNSESMNGYHDLVMNAVQMYNQSQGVLGPFGAQISRQIQDSVGNLVYDLRSEKDQIDTFLDTLKKAGLQNVSKKGAVGGSAMIKPGNQGMDTDSLGNMAQQKANIRRTQENPGSVVTANRRAMPFNLNQNQAQANMSNFLDKSTKKKSSNKKKKK